MLTLWRRFESFLTKALVAGVIACFAYWIISQVLPDSPGRQAVLLIPGIVIVIDFVIFGALVILSPLMWLFAIITGTIGVGVAVGNRLSDKRQ